MGLKDTAASLIRRFADTLGKPAFSGTPFPDGGVKHPEQLTKELGGTGTFNFGGYIRQEDFNPEMDGQTAITNLDEMRRSDSQVHAALEVVKLPIRTATYEVAPSDPNDPEAVMIAKFVEWVLFTGMATSWDDVIRQALLMLDFGFMLFEKVWTVQEDGPYAGYITLHKLAPRPPKTIWQWFTDEDGGLLSIKQLTVKAGTYQFLDVPASKLVRFTYQQEGDNFMGISMLRSAYPHWLIKKNLYVIDAIRAQRYGVGIPRAKLAEGYRPTEDDKAAIATMLQGLSSHQHAYLIEPAQMTVDILVPQGTRGGVDIMSSVEHQNEQITRNILAQFLDMGGKAQGGSRALGASAMDFFLNAIESIAHQICDVLNKQLIKDLVDMNFETTKYPQLNTIGIKETDVGILAQAAAALTTAGLLTPDPATENTFRELLDLPEKPGTSLTAPPIGGLPPEALGTPATPATGAPMNAETSRTDELPAQAATAAPTPAEASTDVPMTATMTAAAAAKEAKEPDMVYTPPPGAAPSMVSIPAVSTVTQSLPAVPSNVPVVRTTFPSSGVADEEDHSRSRPFHEPSISLATKKAPVHCPQGTFWRTPTLREASILSLREMPRQLDIARSELRNMLLGVREEQVSRIASAAAHAPLGDMPKPPLVGKMASVIAKAMQETYDYGHGQVVRELRRQLKDGAVRFAAADKPVALASTIRPQQQLTASAKLSAQSASDKLMAQALAEALRLKRAGWEPDEIEDALHIHLGELSEADVTRLSNMEVNEAFSLGRVAASDEFKQSIEKAIYSAILDNNVCKVCEALDDKEFTVDSDEYRENTPPHPNCEGGDQCRCVWIYVLKSGVEDEDIGLRDRLALAEWDESQHPRDDDGKFTDGDGASGGGDKPAAPPHHERLKSEAEKGVDAVEALLPAAIDSADFSDVPISHWGDLSADVADKVYAGWIEDHEDDFYEAGDEAREEWLTNHEDLDPVNLFHATEESFITRATQEGMDIDPESLDFKTFGGEPLPELYLNALRKSDGSELTAAEKVTADKLFNDEVEVKRQEIEDKLRQSDAYMEAGDEAQHDAASTAWNNLDDDEKFEIAVKKGYADAAAAAPAHSEPDEWNWSDAAEDSQSYNQTRVIARALAQKRTEQLLRERGLANDPDPTHDISEQVESMAANVWEHWKESSTSDVGLALQLAAVKELGAVNRLTLEQEEAAAIGAMHAFTTENERAAIIAEAGKKGIASSNAAVIKQQEELGMARLQAYVRAQWETTQFVLQKSGTETVDAYRAIMLPGDLVEKAKAELIVKGQYEKYAKLSDIQLKRNGVASATLNRRVANDWNGVGDKPANAKRVVIRYALPREAVFSLPVYGQNMHSEQEVVVLGAASGIKWDAWQDFAPPITDDNRPLREGWPE